jgi:hypothetical protein
LGIKSAYWKVEADPAVIKLMVEEELWRNASFENSHGITPENVGEHLIKPMRVEVQCHLERKQTSMLMALEECRGGQGYLIGFDPTAQNWALVYRETDGTYTLNSYSDSFIALLNHM